MAQNYTNIFDKILENAQISAMVSVLLKTHLFFMHIITPCGVSISVLHFL